MSRVSDNNSESKEELQGNLTENELNAITFNTRSNITDEKIDLIFSKGKRKLPEVSKDQSPYFIFIVGSPGVGKTSKLKSLFKYENISNKLGEERKLKEEFKKSNVTYNDFYEISLDLILEKVVPWRNATMKLYNFIRGNQENYELTLNNINEISKFAIYQTSTENFGLTKKKIEKQMANIKTKRTKTGGAGRFYTIAEEALQRAIKKRHHIIYDTTLDGTTNKIDKVIKLLELGQQGNSGLKYKIKVILVTAPEEQIVQQLNSRHSRMIEKRKGIRAIKPSLVRKFLSDNLTGWEAAKLHYKAIEPSNTKTYNKDDFDFLQIRGGPLKNNTMKQNTNNILEKLERLTVKNNNNKKQNTNNILERLQRLTVKNNNNKKQNNK
jgi:hypothetical protein